MMNNNIPYGTIPKITRNDVDVGYVVRYFIQLLSNKNVIEVNKTQFDKFSKLPPYKGISFKWYIAGLNQNVRSKNQVTMDYYIKSTPELKYILVGPLQYYLGVDKNINS